MKGSRIAGHGLRHEGAPFHVVDGYVMRTTRYWTTTGDGFAVCECGAQSDVLTSAAARKRWHAEHKADLTRGAVTL